jgi:putative membrane protein
MMSDHHSMGGTAGWMMSVMGFAGLAWVILCLAILVLIIVAVVWLIDRFRGGSARSGGRASEALEELDRRYAKGEIDRDTYLQMRRDLAGP